MPLLAVLGWGLVAQSAVRRPVVDRSAMREAISSARAAPEVSLVSPASYAHFLRAQRAALEGRHQDAVDALRLALATDEDSPYLLTRLGEEYALLGDDARAERELRRAVARHPRYYPGRVMLARVLMEARRGAQAQAQLRQALRLAPREPEAYLLLAMVAESRGDVAGAVAAVRKALYLEPQLAIGHAMLVAMYGQLGQPEEAERARRNALRALEGLDDEVMLRGVESMTVGGLRRALEPAVKQGRSGAR